MDAIQIRFMDYNSFGKWHTFMAVTVLGVSRIEQALDVLAGQERFPQEASSSMAWKLIRR